MAAFLRRAPSRELSPRASSVHDHAALQPAQSPSFARREWRAGARRGSAWLPASASARHLGARCREEVVMETLKTLTYEVTGRVARITLNRPARGNGINLHMPRELAECVERADLDPRVHV